MEEEIINELKDMIADGKTGCIVFDLGIAPFWDNIDIKFSLGSVELPDQKINHRYNNKSYYTITRKYGRKLSKIGYPYFFPLQSAEPSHKDLWILALSLTYHLDERREKFLKNNLEIEAVYPVEFFFPLQVCVTKENPVCSLSLRLWLAEEKPCITFKTSTCGADGVIHREIYTNLNDHPKCKSDIITMLDAPEEIPSPDNHCHGLVYQTILKPHACSIEELWI